MKKKFILALIIVILLPVFSFAASQPKSVRTIDPLVSTDWLEANLESQGLVIVDVREAEDFSVGHIPGSVNIPFGNWWVMEGNLLLQLPEASMLFDLISQAGIAADSRVVLIQKTDGAYDRAAGTRVAWTLIYGGIKNVSILNGGINKWVAEEKAVTTDVFTPLYSNYTGQLNSSLVVSKEYVEKKLWRTTIFDARVPEDFFGISYVFASRPGHIPGALNLPTPWIFTTEEGLFKPVDDLEAMAEGVVGKLRCKEIIAYCGVGGYAATWWYILSEVLGYTNVKVYDGAIQEWSADPDAPMRVYSWW